MTGRHLRRLAAGAALLVIGCVAAATQGIAQESAPAPQAAAPTTSPDTFQARALVALSDGDMIPSAYFDGRLGPVRGADALTVVRTDAAGTPVRGASVPVSNSVVGPPSKVVVTPDGRYAITIETLGQRPAGGTDVGLTGLRPGRAITVVDLSAPDRPTIVQRLQGPLRADSLSISSDGRMVAVAVHPGGDGKATPLWVYRLESGRLDRGRAVAIPGWAPGHRLIDAAFHPVRPVLALVDETARELTMAELDPATLRLTRWGNKVEIEKGPYNAHYTPDGRFVMLTATYADTTPRQPPNGFPAGTVYSIRLDSQKDAQGRAQHVVASRAATSNEPEGLAITPDGRFAVTINLERATFPVGDPRRRPYVSLTLVSIDRETGYLRRIGDFGFDGILPEAAAFDRTGRMLAVANFGKVDDPAADGSIDFWRLVEDRADPARSVLVRTGRSAPVQRGINNLAVVH